MIPKKIRSVEFEVNDKHENTYYKQKLKFYCVSKLDIFEMINDLREHVEHLLHNIDLEKNPNIEESYNFIFDLANERHFRINGIYTYKIFPFKITKDIREFYNITDNPEHIRVFKLGIYHNNRSEVSFARGNYLISEYIITYQTKKEHELKYNEYSTSFYHNNDEHCYEIIYDGKETISINRPDDKSNCIEVKYNNRQDLKNFLIRFLMHYEDEQRKGNYNMINEYTDSRYMIRSDKVEARHNCVNIYYYPNDYEFNHVCLKIEVPKFISIMKDILTKIDIALFVEEEK